MNKWYEKVLIALIILAPALVCLKSILWGEMAFWYDPARDLLAAWDNLSKLTLIGPTSGIPGIFYGPYWIWLLSGALVFSKDPRFVAFVVGFVPYLVIFPLVLFRFRKILDLKVLILIWLLFIFNYSGYVIQLWNPNITPFLFLVEIYLLVFASWFLPGAFFIGLVGGLILNFHISFGLGMIGGIFVFFLMMCLIQILHEKKKWKSLVMHTILLLIFFFVGMMITFVPFFAFEARHGFTQTHMAIHTLLSPTAVVGQKGLDKVQILEEFFGRLSDNFWIPKPFMSLAGLAGFVYIFYFLGSKKFKIKSAEVRLLLLLVCISFTVLFLYLTSKNPVWNYHFINVEIIFLFILAFILQRFWLARNIFVIFIIVVVFLKLLGFVKGFETPAYTLASYSTKAHIVDIVTQNSGGKKYTVFVYNPAIYTYDYSYIFRMQGKYVSYDPGQIPMGGDLVYLIIPKASQAEVENFIEYRTPKEKYKTIKVWKVPEGTSVIKRVVY